jgi:hypothetical protein
MSIIKIVSDRLHLLAYILTLNGAKYETNLRNVLRYVHVHVAKTNNQLQDTCLYVVITVLAFGSLTIPNHPERLPKYE